jgi:hypothetical protein
LEPTNKLAFKEASALTNNLEFKEASPLLIKVPVKEGEAKGRDFKGDI